MQCPHFDVGECRSCPLMGVPYARQLADKQAAVLAALADALDADTVVAEPFASAEAGFRNKAKFVVTGSAAAPRLGILDPRQHPRHHDGAGVDLRDCGLYEAGMEGVFEACAAAVTAAGLEPYDVAARTGELKNVIVTLSPDREAMVRFVLRSADRLDALGAIGTARCLLLGGAMGKPFYAAGDPFAAERQPDDTRYVLDHFWVKLLGLAATMTTAAVARVARQTLFRPPTLLDTSTCSHDNRNPLPAWRDSAAAGP